MRTTASIAGHPIHPMLIPFPIGLWVFSLVAAFVALYKFKADVLWVVLIGGLIGLLRTFLV